MELKEIKELIKLVSETGVSEVEVERGDFKLSIKKIEEKTTIVQAPQVVQAHIPMMPVSQQVSNNLTERMEAPVSKPEVSVVSNLVTIKSPMIGTFYNTPSPGKPVFVQIGDEIKPGKVLCIVEAMKLFNEIEAEISGTIVKVLVDNASPVEYDQPLFLVEPK